MAKKRPTGACLLLCLIVLACDSDHYKEFAPLEYGGEMFRLKTAWYGGEMRSILEILVSEEAMAFTKRVSMEEVTVRLRDRHGFLLSFKQKRLVLGVGVRQGTFHQASANEEEMPLDVYQAIATWEITSPFRSLPIESLGSEGVGLPADIDEEVKRGEVQ